MFKLIFFAAVLVAFSYGDVDYCDWEGLQCRKGPHIGCDSQYDFDPKTCRKWDNIELINLGDEEIDKILEEHNTARNSTAWGETIPGVKATRLCKMGWDEELALTACFNVWACYDDHDKCRNTETFSHVGQNLYNTYSTDKVSVMDTIVKAVRKWNEEYQLVRSKDIFDSLPRSINDIGHFTQMMKDNSCFVGCCAVKWVSGSKTYQYWVCNYSFVNMVDQPIFERGETASKCEEGPHKYYNGLCASNEEFDISTPIKNSHNKLQKGKGGTKAGKFKEVQAPRGGKKLKGGGGYHHTYHHRYH